jgi:uncharacterized protein (TIGR00730 family)
MPPFVLPLFVKNGKTIMIKAVCVYCGSSPIAPESHKKLAMDLGATLARGGYDLVYGGGVMGLMGLTAKAAFDNGGKVTGVMTRHLQAYEGYARNIGEMVLADTMHERKTKIYEIADAFCVLPGGLGTLDEFFEIITWKQIGLHKKPIFLINPDDYWRPLLHTIQNMVGHQYSPEGTFDLFRVVTDAKELLTVIQDPQDVWDIKAQWHHKPML